MAAQFSVINPLFEADDAHLTDIFDEETFEFVQCHGAEYADSSCYEGWWDGRQKEGFGAVGFVDGARFLGQFQSGLPQGLGLYITPKGSKYIGEFHKGAFQGFGRYINLDGARYEGQFSNGKAMGLGVLFYADGSKEEGEFQGKTLVRSLDTKPVQLAVQAIVANTTDYLRKTAKANKDAKGAQDE
eukprot:m.425743 g.425743  ORF g.425743 m.425743 type:complete len:186 (-) comp56683_c1_seq37:144-701(-)